MFGAAVHTGILFKGIAYESERPEIVAELPSSGRDIQDEEVCWVLPDGSSTWRSIREMAFAHPDDLVGEDGVEAYRMMGEELKWDVLGEPVIENDLYALRDDSRRTKSCSTKHISAKIGKMLPSHDTQ